jgi:hypothetical protein
MIFGMVLAAMTSGAFLMGAVSADSPAVLFGLGAALLFIISGSRK